MKIISIDPGYEKLGVAILEKESGKEKVLYSTCFKTSSKEKFEDRLLLLGREVKKIIKKWKPKALAIETLYFTTNQKTAIRVAEARGVVLYEAIQEGLAINEFTPLEVKVAVTGYGKADKKQIMDMTKRLIVVSKNVVSDDELDAIAIGLTYFARVRQK